MITTIQIRDKVKSELDLIKKDKEGYEGVILRLIELEEKQKRHDKELLIEECKEMAKDNLKTTKKWESTDNKLDWEW